MWLVPFLFSTISVLPEVEGHGKQRSEACRERKLAKGIREQTFDSRREFTMALGTFVVAILHCITYCSLGKNCICPTELRYIRMVQYNRKCHIILFLALYNISQSKYYRVDKCVKLRLLKWNCDRRHLKMQGMYENAKFWNFVFLSFKFYINVYSMLNIRNTFPNEDKKYYTL